MSNHQSSLQQYESIKTQKKHTVLFFSEETYRLFYHIFLQVSSEFSIIPEGFIVNKNSWIGKPNKKLMSIWQSELNNVQSKLHDLFLYKFFEKLFFKSGETFNCIIKNCLIWMIGCWKLDNIGKI